MTIKQHYVPRLYLRNFTSDGKFIFVYDKFEGKRFKSNIDNVAEERYFYDFEEEKNTDTQIVETIFSKIESNFKLCLDKIVNGLRKGSFDDSLKMEFSYYIVISLLRTKESREVLVQLHNTMNTKRKTILESIKIQSPKINEMIHTLESTIPKSEHPKLHARHIFDEQYIQILQSIFLQHIWFFHKTTDNLIEFYTSDQPVAKRANGDNSIHPNSGYACEGMEMHFPLSNEYELIFCDRRYFKKFERIENKVIEVRNEIVQVSNLIQLTNSYRYIYSHNNNFSLARYFRNAYPDYCKSSRQRIFAD